MIKGGWVNYHWIQLGYQAADAVAGGAWSFTMTYLLLMGMKLVGKYLPALRLRVDVEGEEQGVDEAEIGEFAYDYVERIREVKPVESETESQHSQPEEDFRQTIVVDPENDKEMGVTARELRRTSFDQDSIHSVSPGYTSQ